MTITLKNPRKILLAGLPQAVIVNEYHAGVAITPGMLVELYNNSGLKVRPNASATELTAVAVALEQTIQNKTIDEVYAVGDLVEFAFLQRGAVIYALVPSGQNITMGALLQSNGDGKLKAATATTQDANLGTFQALETTGAVTADTRLRVQVIQ